MVYIQTEFDILMVVAGIFAGGYGKRLLPLTESTPKVLLEIGDELPLLDHTLKKIKRSGIEKIYLMIGHLSEAIIGRYGKTWNGIHFHYLVEKTPMGTLWAIRNLLDNIPQEEDLLLINGDVVADISLRDFIRDSNDTDSFMNMVTSDLRSPYGILELDGRRVLEFKEKPLLQIPINTGIYYIKKDAFAHFRREYDELNIEPTVFSDMAKEGLISSYSIGSNFTQSLDGFKDLERIREEFKGRKDMSWGILKSEETGTGYSYTCHIWKGEELDLDITEGSHITIKCTSGSVELNTLKGPKSLGLGMKADVIGSFQMRIIAVDEACLLLTTDHDYFQ